jgi:hypothetical protein
MSRPEGADAMSVTAAIERTRDRADECRVRVGKVRFLSIPEHPFVTVEGAGPPTDDSFGARLPGLYAMAYGVHFALKRRGLTERVGPLEGLWWTVDETRGLDEILGLGADRLSWRWRLMIALPDDVTDEELAEHLEVARTKVDASVAGTMAIERFEEGDSAQIMHVGPYGDERPTIERLHAAIAEAGYRPLDVTTRSTSGIPAGRLPRSSGRCCASPSIAERHGLRCDR